MMIYALNETDADAESLRRDNVINCYVDEPEKQESKSYLRILDGTMKG
jgi:hypothetical protein